MRAVRGLLVGVALAGPAVANPCDPGARLDFPLSVVLRDEATQYTIDAIMADDVPPDADPIQPYATAYRLGLAERAAALPPDLSGLPYLIALSEVASYPDPLYSLLVAAQSAVLPEMIAAADRHGLPDEAKLLRVPLAVFPDWDAGPSARSAMLDGDGLGALKEWAMDRSSRSLHAAAPRISAATEALIAGDPKLTAEYEARRQAVPPDRRIDHLVERLVAECLADWWTPEEADAAFAGMAQPQSDILILFFFLAESFNGSTHQYFYNSSGTMAPQLADLLDRIGLPDHADGIREGMAMFPAPYPRDTDARRDVMAGFTEAEDEALYALTIWADDSKVTEAMVRLAKDSGLMPQ
jgi:Domain of unknown function (DUF4375)